MPDGSLTTQLLDLANKVNDIRTDVAVIKVQTSPIQDHEQRLRALEAGRSKLAAWWGGAAVIGGAIGYALSYLPRPR